MIQQTNTPPTALTSCGVFLPYLDVLACLDLILKTINN